MEKRCSGGVFPTSIKIGEGLGLLARVTSLPADVREVSQEECMLRREWADNAR